MQPVITWGGVTGIVVRYRQPIKDVRTGRWFVAEPGCYGHDQAALDATKVWFDDMLDAWKYAIEKSYGQKARVGGV